MAEIEIMSNGNIKILGVALGERIGKASIILAENGINSKRNQTHYVEGKGNIASLNVGTSLSFARGCSIQYDTEWSGTRIVRVIIFGLKGSEINTVEIKTFIKKLSSELGVELIEGSNSIDQGETYICKTNLLELKLDIPSKDKNFISLFIDLKNQIQNSYTGAYNCKVINDLYIGYLDSLVSQGSYYAKPNKVNIKQKVFDFDLRKSRIFIKALIVVLCLVLLYFLASSYRYDTFKDKNRYMRYDKWEQVYEKYDQHSKKWIRNY